ncbi:hypothetical protein [Streptomyces sp. NPDC088115]|uniref:hypothetical protein n=1 Tax=Streptomyces sp. NPDC088115 TaxID=3365824 RepID=UPI003801521D
MSTNPSAYIGATMIIRSSIHAPTRSPQWAGGGSPGPGMPGIQAGGYIPYGCCW